MTSVCGSVDSIKEEPEIDGSHIIVVHDFAGEPFEVLIRPDEVVTLLKVLQSGALKRVDQRTPTFPILAMTAVDVGYAEAEAGLLVATESVGTIALRDPVEMFQQLRDKAAMAIDYINGNRH